jgi:glucosamine--fructose-6-phosphate aminotransferase (isomerizing)
MWLATAAAALGSGAAVLGQWQQPPAEACGIVAYIGQDPAVNYLLEGLLILQNRGYDSAGVATLGDDHTLVATKFASRGSTSDSIQILQDEAPPRHEGHKAGIAHTRWATHGGKTDANAHPHMDRKERIALVHNGTIENATELRDQLKSEHGIEFKSQTDTEVIVQLIGVYMDTGLDVMDALKKAMEILEGTYGLAILSRDKPDQIVAARNGSPLVIGIGKDQMFVASEHTAFGRHTSEYISLNDGEVAVVTAKNMDLDMSRIENAPKEDILLSPAPYDHWTIREIMEQPEAVARALNYGGRLSSGSDVCLGGLESNYNMLLGIRNLVIAACGTSFFAGQYGAALMRYLNAFDTIQVVDAAELNGHFWPHPHSDAGLLVISQSGETKDVHRGVVLAEDYDIPRFSVINAVGSLIARTTKCGVYVNAGREHAVASTKAFITQVTVLALISAWFAQYREPEGKPSQRRLELANALHRLPTYVGMSLQGRENIKQIAAKIKDKEHMFVLGRGFAESIAQEGALKIKEITYLHAEGYSGGALKHGPFALIEKGTPIIMVILDDQNAALMRTAAEEVRARGAYTIVITDNPALAHEVSDEYINIPRNGPLTALLAVVPLQLLAYELAIARGIDPDKPKNLAKSVTVD